MISSYSFKRQEETIAIEKAMKKLFKKKRPVMNDFKNKICILCPYKCTTCSFCWNIFYKFKNTLLDYRAPLTVLNTLINGYYNGSYVPTFYFLKTNICSICYKYGQGCSTVAIDDSCPSKYLTQIDSDENIENSIKSGEDLYGEFDQYDYTNGRTYYSNYYQQEYGFVSNSKPKLEVSGEKMQKLVNKLFELTENEYQQP